MKTSEYILAMAKHNTVMMECRSEMV